ncbi:Uncharacterized conserved protein, contains ParB-like and HNH nuclease domains [Chitinophaga terrae (ex Kim and Jung 2007)]|uniref:Uncharacterized conserved protein, contains ParB-like and HNH nuclease domains n=1 Tax=Chitinophaga terrae (ex Kim and Jung 2007) TaxID=408074 RepID=A0A1H4BIC5_9BACT|nr:DUF262 domain-containing protein [Chitinophaga terrae (ex Kim and Jung 2007)]MDQ0109315.1 uncharacterized protein with ParB-like and HNH nuclease domain [Chitinophaga terrae (ex Kim and Jung 2007)]GEP89556.1 hypothetical protein CTE07_12010 [Chitinophaga terrae (ex Kim and Jung 2007)]SEA47552.1 Uncharacterized conserved protein, contains ParB-like and HNH nuclease domains [Chitinophaga terrae (ex Kim and Jung 2007)]
MSNSTNNIQIQFNYLDVENCFKNFYVVPDYQREYVWTEVQINQLLDDIYEEFDFNPNKEYFIGSTVVFKNNDGFYELIDGQQRTTSIFLIICAFKKIYREREIDTDTIERMIKDKTVNALGDSVDCYKLELQYKDSSNILSKIANNLERPENLTGSAERLYNAYENVISFLKNRFKEDEDPVKLKKFFVYIFRKLKFIQIETPEINDALKIFETINERGVGLNPMDLLKNLLFRQVNRNDFNSLKDKWKTLIKLLEKNNEKPLRFLRYFIMSNYKVNNQRGEEIIREEEIYKWFIRPENVAQCNYEKEPFEFVELLLENATCYINFFKGLNKDGSKNVYLDNISKLGGGAFKQHLILLLAGRNLPQDLFNHFAKQIETLVFYYFITKEPTKEFERNFSKWAKSVLRIKSREELNNFVKENIQPVITSKENEYKLYFTETRQNNLQQYRIRYILAKIAQYLDQERLGSYIPQVLDNYITKGVEIEHILPFNPTESLRNEIGEEYDDLKIRLGNLTLLEKTMNIVVGNDFFSKKVIEYSKSPFYISKSIAGLDTIGINSSVTRLNLKLRSYEYWNKETIIDRQNLLYELSKDIWKIEI